jgi:uncharacterized protein YndB with AHSA1/START domain
LFSELGPILST